MTEHLTFYKNHGSHPLLSRKFYNWVTIAAYALGLFASFFVADIVRAPPALFWSFAVAIFCLLGVFLGRPSLYIYLFVGYFCLFPTNYFLGFIPLPLPGMVSDLVFGPLIAVITLSLIERKKQIDVTIFPWIFLGLAGLSWYVNGKPSMVMALQVILVNLKFFLAWWFVRLTGAFSSEKQCVRWTWTYIFFATIQYFFNMIHQRSPFLRYHPDASTGTFSVGGAHFVGYLSVFALYMIAGWYISRGYAARTRVKLGVMGIAAILIYDLVFMTDTKHALFLFPVLGIPILLHPKLAIRYRIPVIIGGVMVLIAANIYMHGKLNDGGVTMFRSIRSGMEQGGKSTVFTLVTKDFHKIVRYPLLGAGPGTFTSPQAVKKETSLARKYISPFMWASRRLAAIGRVGATPTASMVGTPLSDLHTFMGEFGWLGAIVFYSFQFWACFTLYKKSCRLPIHRMEAGLSLALCSCLLFLTTISLTFPIFTIGAVTYVLWVLIGKVWDVDPKKLSPPHPMR